MRKNEFLIYVTGVGFVHAFQGDGLNLLDEDIEDGFIDYVYWHIYDIELNGTPMFKDKYDDGMALLEKDWEEYEQSELIDIVRDWVGYNLPWALVA